MTSISFFTPTDFPNKFESKSCLITYNEVLEISQGGPLLGRLFVNNTEVNPGSKFGGPPLIDDNHLYVPIYVRKFCITGFRVCIIDLNTLGLRYIGKIHPLIFLDKVLGNKLYFFKDISKSKCEFIEIAK